MFVIVVGGGKVGSYLASLLLAEGQQVRVIEVRPEVLARLREEVPEEYTLAGDGTDPAVLEAAGIKATHVLAAVTGEDETNLVVTTLARFEYDVPRIIARVNNPKNAWLFTPEMGVDVALNQADVLARLIAEEMSLGDMMTLLKLRKGEYSLVEEKVHPSSAAAGRAIRELDLPLESTLVAILRHGQLVVPHGNTVLQPADEVLAVVHRSCLGELAGVLGKRV
jgi:trk system potassium uptake protein TrkA